MLPLDRMLTLKTLPFLLSERLAGQTAENMALTASLVGAFAMENAFLDADQTEKHRQKAIAEVEPVEGKLFRGQIIVRRGDIVSEEEAARIRAVGAYASTVNFNSIAGTALHLLLVFCLSVILLSPAVTRVRLKTAQVLFLCASGVLYLLLAGLLTTIDGLPRWLPLSAILPTGAFTILIAMLISPLVAILYSTVLSAALLPLVGMDVFSFLFAFITGVVGTAVVRQAERRIDLMKGGAFLALINCLVLAALVMLREHSPAWLLPVIGWGIFNGLACGILSLGLLPIIEHLLNAPTRFRLIELSDLNAPSSSGCSPWPPAPTPTPSAWPTWPNRPAPAIGANALLARVGAYYHDIGKIDQSEYFIENQRAGTTSTTT